MKRKRRLRIDILKVIKFIIIPGIIIIYIWCQCKHIESKLNGVADRKNEFEIKNINTEMLKNIEDFKRENYSKYGENVNTLHADLRSRYGIIEDGSDKGIIIPMQDIIPNYAQFLGKYDKALIGYGILDGKLCLKYPLELNKMYISEQKLEDKININESNGKQFYPIYLYWGRGEEKIEDFEVRLYATGNVKLNGTSPDYPIYVKFNNELEVVKDLKDIQRVTKVQESGKTLFIDCNRGLYALSKFDGIKLYSMSVFGKSDILFDFNKKDMYRIYKPENNIAYFYLEIAPNTHIEEKGLSLDIKQFNYLSENEKNYGVNFEESYDYNYGVFAKIYDDGLLVLNGIPEEDIYIKISNGLEITNEFKEEWNEETFVAKKKKNINISLEEIRETLNSDGLAGSRENREQMKLLFRDKETGELNSNLRMNLLLREREKSAKMNSDISCAYIYVSKNTQIAEYVMKININQK